MAPVQELVNRIRIGTDTPTRDFVEGPLSSLQGRDEGDRELGVEPRRGEPAGGDFVSTHHPQQVDHRGHLTATATRCPT